MNFGKKFPCQKVKRNDERIREKQCKNALKDQKVRHSSSLTHYDLLKDQVCNSQFAAIVVI